MSKTEIKKINHNFDLALKKVREAGRRGLGLAGGQLLSDAILRSPTVPYKEGTLRGSGSVAVSGSIEVTSDDLGYDGGNPESSGEGSKEKRNEITAVVGFNQPYAGKLHFIEPTGGFSEPSAGTNYLFGKMAVYNKTYFGMVAREIKEVL